MTDKRTVYDLLVEWDDKSSKPGLTKELERELENLGYTFTTEIARTGSTYLLVKHPKRKTRQSLKVRIADHGASASAQALHGENDLYVYDRRSLGVVLGWLAAEAGIDIGKLGSRWKKTAAEGYQEWQDEKDSAGQEARWAEQARQQNIKHAKRHDEQQRQAALEVFNRVGRRLPELRALLDEYEAAGRNPEYGKRKRKTVRREVVARIMQLTGPWSKYWKGGLAVQKLADDLEQYGSEFN